MFDINEKFYLGRTIDRLQPLRYDPDNLTTHALVVGMTGSGKTGLCIGLLEEAALQNIPALIIDPKGDITNLLLHFPDLLPSDFKPWVNPDEARRAGQSLESAAAAAAAAWKNGLAEWDISPERIRALSNSARFTVFTPGSDAGIPVSIMANLKAPEITWDGNKELLREKISSTVTALLGLVGLHEIDPISSREHILLSNIFELAWKNGMDLTLQELILQTQNPPFEKLGVFDINTFFPEKERFGLAMLLNNILAAPSFQAWIDGQPLEIESLLYASDGRPRHSIFYIAHLSDEERMFFVTLLYSAVETWMRSQSGATSLQAILYFDEIFGYMPPVKNPPSKEIMLRLLKQGRAFGVGQILVTQNPTDLDYKGLSNIGTWCIGKLQTDNDKNRLLDGLQGASPDMDRGYYDDCIAGLGKRQFLMHNVHEKEPLLFETRWVMSYLAGPVSRNKIALLNRLAGVDQYPKSPRDSEASWHPQARESEMAFAPIPKTGALPLESNQDVLASLPGSKTRPPIPRDIDEYFMPNNLTLSQAARLSNRALPAEARPLGLIYRPVLVAQAEIRYRKPRYDLDYEGSETALVLEADRRGAIRWDDWLSGRLDPEILAGEPAPNASFDILNAPLDNGNMLRSLKTDFVDWVYRNSEVAVRVNQKLKVYAGPEISQSEFRRRSVEAARAARNLEIDKVEEKYERKLDRIEARLRREQRELRQDEAELSQRRMEEYGTHAENVLSLFTRRSRRLSSSLTKRRMTEKAEADVEESLDAIEDFKEEIVNLEEELSRAIEDVKAKWAEIADDMDEIPVNPYKKDILVDLFGVAWFPYHLFEVDGGIQEFPGFQNE